MVINVTRQQWPIGQGCFASGAISAADRSFVYVYDCGSENLNALRQSIQCLYPKNNIIDALFISHLDSDHVNGVDFLCTSCGYKIDTVYLPYLSMIDCLIVIGASLADNSFSWSLAEATITPRKWFGQRGARNIVMVQRRDIEDEGGVEVPREPHPDIQDKILKVKRDMKLNPRLKSFSVPPFYRKYAMSKKEAALSFAQSKTVVFVAGSYHDVIWVIVPFVPPLPKYAIAAFIKKVKEELGLKISYKSTRSRKDVGQLLDILQDRATRNKLQAAYSTLARDHNSVSMCLYSGPFHRQEDKITWEVMSPKNDFWQNYYMDFTDRKCGWIGTGDLTLNIDHHLDAFKKHYRSIRENISTVLLPHHGSHYNFSPDLGYFCSSRISLTSAGSRNRFKHPHPGVIATMRLLGSKVFNVTEEQSSTVIEEIKIER